MSVVNSIVIVYSRIQSVASKILKYCQLKNPLRNFFLWFFVTPPALRDDPRSKMRTTVEHRFSVVKRKSVSRMLFLIYDSKLCVEQLMHDIGLNGTHMLIDVGSDAT